MSSQTIETTQPEIAGPIEVVSVSGPIPPYLPAGPAVEITLKNILDKPVISLTVTLDLNPGMPPGTYAFEFGITQSNPLPPGGTASYARVLINGGFGDNVTYPLRITGMLKDGTTFDNTLQVRILEPPPTISQ